MQMIWIVLAVAWGASITQNPDESDIRFVERITGETVITPEAPQIGRTSTLISGTETLVAFTRGAEADGGDVNLNVFVKTRNRAHGRVPVAIACTFEGGPAEVRSFFYTKVAGESRPVLGVICRWSSTHAGASCTSADELLLFRVTEKVIARVPMERFEKVLYEERKPSPEADYTCKTERFRDAKEAKALLSRVH